MPTRPIFDRSLGEIQDDLLRLSSMVDCAIVSSIRALSERDAELAKQVSADDTLLNNVRYNLEERVYSLIATQQPTGMDLRALVGAVSVATNLERMGDHAAGIARLTLRMCDQPLLKPLVDIPQMAEIARQMARNALDAYLHRDILLAEKVATQDLRVNQLHEQVYHELLGFMMRDPSTIERATYLLWVSHNLERIGDRAKNICERAIYLVTGELKEFSGHPS